MEEYMITLDGVLSSLGTATWTLRENVLEVMAWTVLEGRR